MPTIQTLLGKIYSISYGLGGRDDVQFGLTVELKGNGWGTVDFIGVWDYNHIETPSEYATWTEESRTNKLVALNRKISELLKITNVKTIDQLKNKPVEATFENGILKSWRILTEVL